MEDLKTDNKILIKTKGNRKQRIRYFVRDYVLPLVGWSYAVHKEKVVEVSETQSMKQTKFNICYDEEEKLVKCTYRGITIKIKTTDKLIADSEKLLFEKLFKKYYELDGKLLYHKYDFDDGKGQINRKIYEYAIQRGLCDYLTHNAGNNNSTSAASLESLISILEKWSTKTYEGHNVCFGFIFNLENNKTNDVKGVENGSVFGSFLQFLEDEYAAILSDGISSVMELNNNCNLVDYHSIIDSNDVINSCDTKEGYSPMRFSQIIIKYVKENKLGIFLLKNGDIIIAKYSDKKPRISFIKRNSKWLNFDYTSFEKRIQNVIQGIVDTTLLKQIYDTMLDVSLSHSGGIIAVVDYREEANGNKSKLDKIINKIDFLNVIEPDSIKSEYEELFFEEIESKIKSRNIKVDSNLKLMIKSKNKIGFDEELINNYNLEIDALKKDTIKKLTKKYYIEKIIKNNRHFSEINRKLRSELIGLDGACILNKDGKMLTFGAIIQNDSGSSGGGRGAAAKKLSNYGGFAIKISTDGYIEVYHKENRIYSIK